MRKNLFPDCLILQFQPLKLRYPQRWENTSKLILFLIESKIYRDWSRMIYDVFRHDLYVNQIDSSRLRAKTILLARQSGTCCIDSCDEIAIKQPGVFGSFQVESGIRASTYAPRDLFDRLLPPIATLVESLPIARKLHNSIKWIRQDYESLRESRWPDDAPTLNRYKYVDAFFVTNLLLAAMMREAKRAERDYFADSANGSIKHNLAAKYNLIHLMKHDSFHTHVRKYTWWSKKNII